MAKNMTLILDVNGTPLDISKYVFKRKDLGGAPEYINGENAGNSKAGTKIRDRVNTLYNAYFPLLFLPEDVLFSIAKKCELSSQTVTYSGPVGAGNGGLVTVSAQLSLSGWEYAYTIDEVDFYQGAVITLEADE